MAIWRNRITLIWAILVAATFLSFETMTLASLIHDARFRARSGHLLRLAVLRGRPASLAFVSPHSD
ncbi:hypothetical protein [Sphingobium sp. CFD-1]|uniref:hypothetical protein n=1 Tax=Sphingobium sp. CFD-1 TaxID=2878545 RepID=UPI00214D0F94|nr:hypothetical protein [Sphingobium sp. CFD-1]